MRRAHRLGELRAVAAFVLLSGLLATPTPAGAAKDVPFTITADSIEYDSAQKIYTARGNVRIHEDPQTLTADWVMFSSETRQGLASGNVVHQDGPDRLTGDFLQFNIDTLKGFVRQGVLTSDESQYTLRAVEVRKTGEETYTFKKTRFTTCKCPSGDPSWEIKADEAELDTEGYAIAKNASFEMFGLPVMWLPWAAYPVKRERSTGFLFPEINKTNRSGMDIGLPFFWAARHDLNLVFTPQYLRDRGVKGAMEAEWIRPGGSKGGFWFTILSDDSIEDDDPQQPIDELRWAVKTRQDWRLPGGVRAKIDGNAMRDNLFVRDFRDMREHVHDRFLESVAFAEKDFFEAGWLQASVGSRFADDLQNPDDLDRDKQLIQRLPEVELGVLSKPLLRAGPVTFVAALEGDYTYFWQRDKASDEQPASLIVGDDVFVDTGIDGVPSSREQNGAGQVVNPDQHRDDFTTNGGPEGDGVFQEGELVGDRGHRVLLHPRLSAPFRILDAVEVVPEVGYHATLYDTDAQGFVDRGMVTGRLDLRTQLSRTLEPAFISRPVVHIVEPFFSWGIVQQTSQRGNPLFIPETAQPQIRVRELHLDNVTRDPADRIESFHGFTFGTRHELIGRSLSSILDPETGEVSYVSDQSRLVADAVLAYSYEISGNRLGDLIFEGNWWPWANWNAKWQLGYDPSRNQVDQGMFRFGYWSIHGHNLSVSYRYLQRIPHFFEEFRSDRDRFDDFENDFDKVNQLYLTARWAMTRQWALTYDFGYTFEQSLFLRNRGGIEFTSKCECWALRLTGDFRRETGFDIGFRYTLLGLGVDTVRPFSSNAGAGLENLNRR